MSYRFYQYSSNVHGTTKYIRKINYGDILHIQTKSVCFDLTLFSSFPLRRRTIFQYLINLISN